MAREGDNRLLVPLQRTRLHEEIVERLKDRIVGGEIKPGEKLPPEREIAESLHVNRSTVREALNKLEALELVEIKHGKGIFVKDYLDSGSLDLLPRLLFKDGIPDEEVLRGLLDMRKLILPEIARRAAVNRTEKDVQQLERVVLAHDERPIAERDRRVHTLIARASGNPLFAILLNSFTKSLADYAFLYFDDEANQRRSETFHREIVGAIKNRKPEKAARIMREVLVFVEDVTSRLYARGKG